MVCIEAPQIVSDAMFALEQDYPNLHDVPLRDLHLVVNPRVADSMLDHYEKMIEELDETCRL